MKRSTTICLASSRVQSPKRNEWNIYGNTWMDNVDGQRGWTTWMDNVEINGVHGLSPSSDILIAAIRCSTMSGRLFRC